RPRLLLDSMKRRRQRRANRRTGSEEEVDCHGLAFDQIVIEVELLPVLVDDARSGNFCGTERIDFGFWNRRVGDGIDWSSFGRGWCDHGASQVHPALPALATSLRRDIRMHRTHVDYFLLSVRGRRARRLRFLRCSQDRTEKNE